MYSTMRSSSKSANMRQTGLRSLAMMTLWCVAIVAATTASTDSQCYEDNEDLEALTARYNSMRYKKDNDQEIAEVLKKIEYLRSGFVKNPYKNVDAIDIMNLANKRQEQAAKLAARLAEKERIQPDIDYVDQRAGALIKKFMNLHQGVWKSRKGLEKIEHNSGKMLKFQNQIITLSQFCNAHKSTQLNELRQAYGLYISLIKLRHRLHNTDEFNKIKDHFGRIKLYKDSTFCMVFEDLDVEIDALEWNDTNTMLVRTKETLSIKTLMDQIFKVGIAELFDMFDYIVTKKMLEYKKLNLKFAKGHAGIFTNTRTIRAKYAEFANQKIQYPYCGKNGDYF